MRGSGVNPSSWLAGPGGLLLAKQPGREPEAEADYREAAEAGNTDARFNLGLLLANQPGREEGRRHAAPTREEAATLATA